MEKVSEELWDFHKKLLESLQIESSGEGRYFFSLTKDDTTKSYQLGAPKGNLVLKSLYLDFSGEYLSRQELDWLNSALEIDGFRNGDPNIKRAKRVFTDTDGSLCYDLNYQDMIYIDASEGTAEVVPGVDIFLRSDSFKEQVEPNLLAEPENLIPLVKKHFNVAREQDAALLAIFLGTALCGCERPHPLLMISGEKGSSKSTTLRKIEAILDPKIGGLTATPRTLQDLDIRLYNSYFVALDNMTKLTKDMSEHIAIACTSGSVSKRKLYSDGTEYIMNITAFVGINSITQMVSESDVLDRTLWLKLQRIRPKAMRTEAEIWDEFEKDLPDILGCLFNALAVAVADMDEPEYDHLIRLADFHIMALKIGKAIGLEYVEVNDLLLKNQNRINQESIFSDVVGSCILEFMEDHEDYVGSMTDFLKELERVAARNKLSSDLLPKAPNRLSYKMGKIKSNLEQYAGIVFSIKNVGNFRQIHIKKR